MDIEKFFKSHARYKKVSYIPNFGNAGDALIGLGTLAFFKKNEIEYEICSNPCNTKNDVLVYAGGGTMTGFYCRSETKLVEMLRTGKDAVILPHTIKIIPKCLLEKRDNLTIFCRERVTYEKMKKTEHGQVFLDRDMAFHLQLEAGHLCGKSVSFLIAKGILTGSLKDRLRMLKRSCVALNTYSQCFKLSMRTNTLNCFRNDAERGDKDLPLQNHDISNDYSLGSETKPTIDLSAFLLLKTLDRFEVIKTDRLHCSIGAALLGKQVQFSSNDYFKNKAVYDYSLKEQFRNVAWVDISI